MRGLVFFIFFMITTIAVSKEKSDSTSHPVKLSGTLSLNSNGIAPIPAFSLGKPVVSANLSIAKNRFSYDPLLSYGLDLKPWIIDNWFHYLLVDKPKFELRTGLCISMFFSEYETSDPDDEIWQGQRYTTLELAMKYKISKTSSLSFMVWRDQGLDPGTITGFFINLEAEKSDIRLGKHFMMGLTLQVFNLEYTDRNDGIFISPKISCASTDVPAFIFFQAIQPLTYDMETEPEFQWNLGVGFSF